jgi:RNA polymerase primary sigma factor
VLDGQGGQAANDPPAAHLVDAHPPRLTEQPAFIQGLETAAAPVIGPSGEDVCAFDLTGWEAEEDLPAPTGDPALAAAAFELHEAISEHQPVDTSADWEDFEAFLPDRASPLPRVDDAEARERLRLVLLRAVREGSVPYSAIENLTLDEDGAPNEQARALLSMVINDLGAEPKRTLRFSLSPRRNLTRRV